MVCNLMWILPHCDKPMERKHKHNFMGPGLGGLSAREGSNHHHQIMITRGIIEIMLFYVQGRSSFLKQIVCLMASGNLSRLMYILVFHQKIQYTVLFYPYYLAPTGAQEMLIIVCPYGPSLSQSLNLLILSSDFFNILLERS